MDWYKDIKYFIIGGTVTLLVNYLVEKYILINYMYKNMFLQLS